jgi:FdhD protein
MKLSDMARPPQQSYRVVAVQGQRAGSHFAREDYIAEEAAIALEYNGIAHAVMMASPTDLEDFAYGFSLSEMLVDDVSQIYDCEVLPSEHGYTLHLQIASSCFASLKERRRNLTGRTGCGLCGTESLAQAVRYPQVLQHTQKFSAEAVTRAMAALREQQVLLGLTGATHAAAWCTADGNIACVREDVGRHNALDKLLGALAIGKYPASSGFVLISSRASYEMVQKTLVAGISLLAAVSGVTGLAQELAQRCGLCLLGFTRGSDYVVYSHPLSLE